MATLQFIPTNTPYIKIDVANIENSHISALIKHNNSYSRCTIIETDEFLDSIEGQLHIYNYDNSKDKQELKDKGYVGYFTYAEGIESGAFVVQLHVSNIEFDRITKLLSNCNNLSHINIETPLHGKSLRYGTTPDDPIAWSIKENNWV